jgi:hypothetical protein
MHRSKGRSESVSSWQYAIMVRRGIGVCDNRGTAGHFLHASFLLLQSGRQPAEAESTEQTVTGFQIAAVGQGAELGK